MVPFFVFTQAIVHNLSEASKAISRAVVEKRIAPQKTKLFNLLSKMFLSQGKKVVEKFRTHHRIAEAYHIPIIEQVDDKIINQGLRDDIDDWAEKIEAYVKATYLVGAFAGIGDYDLGISFDLENPRAVEYFKEYGVNLLREINDTTRDEIRRIIANGLENGDSYTKIAQAIKAQFAAYAAKPKAPKFIRSRAELVAVTELGNAYQAGNIAAIRGAMDTGLRFEKSWLTVGDNRVDPHCKANQAQGWIDIDDTFSSGVDRPLDHPGCRCVLLFRRVAA